MYIYIHPHSSIGFAFGLHYCLFPDMTDVSVSYRPGVYSGSQLGNWPRPIEDFFGTTGERSRFVESVTVYDDQKPKLTHCKCITRVSFLCHGIKLTDLPQRTGY